MSSCRKETVLISQDNQLLCGLRQQYQLCDVCYWLTYVTNVVHWWFMDHFTSMHIHSSNGFDNSWLLGCSPPLHLWVLSPSSTGTFLLELSSRSRSGLGLWSANQRMCCFIWLTVHWDTWHLAMYIDFWYASQEELIELQTNSACYVDYLLRPHHCHFTSRLVDLSLWCHLPPPTHPVGTIVSVVTFPHLFTQ